MAKDSTQSKIPRLDGVTRIPVPGSIRIPQKAQLISAHSKVTRPSSFTGLRPSVTSMASIKKSLSGERISEAACIVGKKTATVVKKFLTKPEKSSTNSEIPVKMMTKDETIILDKGMKDDANQKLMITKQENHSYKRPRETYDDDEEEDNGVMAVNMTRTLTRSETFVRDKNSDSDNNDNDRDTHKNSLLDITHSVISALPTDVQFGSNTMTIGDDDGDSTKFKTRNIELAPILGSITVTLETNSKLHNDATDNCSYERLSDISIPSCDLDATLKPQNRRHEEFDNEDEGHREIIDTSEDFNATFPLASDKGQDKIVLSSTMNSDRLLDLTSKLSPRHQLMNITQNLMDSPDIDLNNTKLLYLSNAEFENAILTPKSSSSEILQSSGGDEPMDIDDPPVKLDDNIFEIPASVTQVLNSHAIQELKQNKPRHSFGLDLTEYTLDCSIELCDVSLSSGAQNQSVSPSLKKQNSFEMDESLGILTPDQMKEFLDSATTNTNLDLPINMQAGSKLALHQMRIDQTPSPEDLPLDPVGVKTDVSDVIVSTQPPPVIHQHHLITYQEISQTDSDSKTDQMTKSNASKVSNSFITSVTSITSLDTGYQGDGEMSRPASRGPADHSPSNGPRKPQLGRQPSFNQNNQPNIPIRRQDPMTDSDFFTESDADDIFHRGDRRAQVIDGQLYGPMLQPANVFITEQPQMEDSCMESSGIFTDVENRCDDELSRSRREADIDMSPDGSTDTVKSNNTEYSNNSQRLQSQRPVSPMSQSNSNILTDSQTSSTIQSSLSSERIGGSACSIGGSGGIVDFSKQPEFKRNATINGDVTITTALKSSTNFSSTGALNINLAGPLKTDDDKKPPIAAQKQTIIITTSSTKTTDTNTIQSSGCSLVSSSSLVKKVSPSRKQHSHGGGGGKHENKTSLKGNIADKLLTKPGSASIGLVKSPGISDNANNSIINDQCDNVGTVCVAGGGSDDSGEMLEKSSALRNSSNGGGGGGGNQENKRPGQINNISVSTPRKITANKWDAVMNKIAENKAVYKKNYSEVKSKVASGVLKRSKADLSKSPTGQSQDSHGNSNCGSLNSVSGLSTPKTPSGKRLLQGASKRGRSYSKDSQQSSQSDLSLSGGSPKLHAKVQGSGRSAKKRDVRTLSISPTDLGPPPKSQTNASTRTKSSSQVLSQKRLSPNIQQITSFSGSKVSPPPAKKAITRRPQAQQQQQQSRSKSPLKDHNRLIGQSQSQQQQQQQQLQQYNGSPKAIGTGIKGISTAAASTPVEVAGGIKINSRISLSHVSPSPISNDNTTPVSSLIHPVQSHKKQHQLHVQQQQQHKEQKSQREAALELHLAHANKSVEALGVLLQYLAYDLDAFSCPSTKKEFVNAQKSLLETRLLLEEAKTSCHELQDQLQDKEVYYSARESELQELHRCEIQKVETSLNEVEVNAKERIVALESELNVKNEEFTSKLQEEINKSEQKFAEYEKEIQVAKEKEDELLKRISVLSTTENELRKKIEETENDFGERLKAASQREKDLTEKINVLNRELEELKYKKENRERELEDKLNLSHDEISILRLSKGPLDQYPSQKNGTTNGSETSISGPNKVQMLQDEVASLRSVLEMKQSEVSELRIKNQELIRAVDDLPAMRMKVSALETRIEDLQIQLKAKAEEEKELVQKNKHLQESLNHEVKNRNRLSLHNEELQWRLKQNSEKFTLTLTELSKSYQEQVGYLNSSKSSINGQDSLDLSHNSSLLASSRINGSDRMIGCFEMDDVSPPASPIIKGVVEKSDSVSWVLEMDDETPEVLASRMIRRAGSFRSSFSEKSPGSRRLYSTPTPVLVVNPLTQSASATSVLRQHSSESMSESHPGSSRIRSKSVTIKSPEQKKLSRQSSTGASSSRKADLLSSSWKDPIYCSSPYNRRSSNSRSPPKESSLPLGTASVPTSSSSSAKPRERADSFNTDNESGLFRKTQPNLITCDTSALTSAERIEMRSLPTHPSVQDLKSLKKCQEIQESAGEAMVSGTNSEDEGCSASSDEAVSSASTSSLETDKQHNMSIDCILIEKINCSLGGTPMEVSWSDDGEQFPSESIV